jgi:diguanylate cyclase (GGDEF)-like protein/PAS domain S-box-containing protein
LQPEVETDPVLAPLQEFQAVMGLTRSLASGAVKAFCESLSVRSFLILPIVVDGQKRGRLAIGDCKAEREWSQSEIGALHTIANMIGASLIREHYIRELEDAKRIIEGSATILFRLRGEPSLPLIYVSHNIAQLGYSAEELIASPQLSKEVIHPDDRPAMREVLMRALAEGRSGSLEFRVFSRDGYYRWFETHYKPLHDAYGRLLEIEGIMTDITQRRDAEQKIAVLARTDPLTGVANRAAFIDRLGQAFTACKRGAKPFAVLYIDLDHFKDVNDTLGHSAGDVLLKAAVDRLSKNCRKNDLVARLGGDEFAILQTDLSGPEDIAPFVTKIHALLAQPFQLGESEVHLGASIGISFYMEGTESPDELLSQADLALYRAKDEGRDQYRFHSDDLDREVRERVSLTEDLRHALVKEGELELYYQPQIEFSTGRIAGMEALIRWNHPTRGLLLPRDFIPIVEKSGATLALGQWVLERACGQMAAWRKAGVAPDTLAINLSLGQLRSGDELVRAITSALEKWGLSPRDLEIDVTEQMLAHVTLTQNDVLEQLHRLGMKISIDEFGTQYSSLDYLKTYRVSSVKIPRTMLAAAAEDPDASAIVRAIVALARELGIEIVAQGIETEAQRALLSTTPTTTKVQGYYYSAPVRACEAKELLRLGLIEPRWQRSGTIAAE